MLNVKTEAGACASALFCAFIGHRPYRPDHYNEGLLNLRFSSFAPRQLMRASLLSAWRRLSEEVSRPFCVG